MGKDVFFVPAHEIEAGARRQKSKTRFREFGPAFPGKAEVESLLDGVQMEDIARRSATEDGVSNGPVCVLTCVEPCRSFEIYRNRETKHLELQPRVRKCLFLYHYTVHPVFGFLNARIQTWFPFSIQIYMNGRSWLAQELDTLDMDYERQDNC